MWCFGTLWCPNWRMSSAVLSGLIRIFLSICLFVCLSVVYTFPPSFASFFLSVTSFITCFPAQSLFIISLYSCFSSFHSLFCLLSLSLLSVHCFWRQGAAIVCLCNDCLPLNKFSQLVSSQLKTAITAGVHREQQQTYIGKKIYIYLKIGFSEIYKLVGVCHIHRCWAEFGKQYISVSYSSQETDSVLQLNIAHVRSASKRQASWQQGL